MDTYKINVNEQFVFHLDDTGISISLQRKIYGVWQTVERYFRPGEGQPMKGHHYARFRRKFAEDPDYRQQFRIGAPNMNQHPRPNQTN